MAPPPFTHMSACVCLYGGMAGETCIIVFCISFSDIRLCPIGFFGVGKQQLSSKFLDFSSQNAAACT